MHWPLCQNPLAYIWISMPRRSQHHYVPILDTGANTQGHGAVRASARMPHNLTDLPVPWPQTIQGNRHSARNPKLPIRHCHRIIVLLFETGPCFVVEVGQEIKILLSSTTSDSQNAF